MDYFRLSKELSFILRHHPEQYNLRLDCEGFVLIDDLIREISNKRKEQIDLNDIMKAIEVSDKIRLEIIDNKIRALYGHSDNDVVKKEPMCPPDILYHGTSHKAISSIMKEGLKPMTRQFVHLSIDVATAKIVGERRDKEPIILEIDAKSAYLEGLKFYKGNECVWLCDYINQKYIKIIGEQNEY